MSEAVKMIEHLESIGHGLILEGDSLRILRGQTLPHSFKSELVKQKHNIMDALRQDEQIKEIGGMVGITGTLYLWSVSRFSTAYMEMMGGGWIAYRESYVPGKSTASSYKLISEGNTFDYVFSKYKSYIEYTTEKRKNVTN
ncbi:hypothetical protein [Planomicrobium sp. YIM 101495]|uniref:hypothetical protein n=1 Tax=Planomicrobium sp. YIM 101495 TaxID=2665160 RepID=UPI0012B7FDBC|nr:hypothetical protein [Planomicrobium sp. YIM 101495]MTD31840.1 hypothetical protein [Planomicrobium sp. YIM 101495]